MVVLIIVYVLIVLFSTTLGAATGMGGGVIMKPVMDMLGHYNATEIGVLTSVCVLTMSLVSVLRRSLEKKVKPAITGPAVNVECGADLSEAVITEITVPAREEHKEQRQDKIAWLNPLLLGLGSVAGGLLGQIIFEKIAAAFVNSQVKIVQNAVLLAFIAFIIIYMLNKHKIGHLNLKRCLWLWYIAAGVFLGLISSFLGIGGGPMNVAILMILFGMDIKKATLYSLITILFAQVSKLLTITFTTGFPAMDYTILPFIAAAGVAGALIGSLISKKASGKGVEILFQSVQILVAAICIYNIVSSAIS